MKNEQLKPLSYESLCEHIEQMQASGEKITVRNVLSRTGGKTGKVAELLKQWQADNAAKQISEAGSVSNEVIQAIMSDKTTAIAKITASYKTQISRVEAILDELSNKCATQESQLSNKDAEFKAANEKYIAKLAVLESQVKAFDIKVLELKQQLKDTQEKLELAIDAKHQAEKNAAVWESKHAGLIVKTSKK